MTILKADNPGKKKFNFKEMFEKIGKRNLIIIGSVLALALVITLNVILLGGDGKDIKGNDDTPVIAPSNSDFFAESIVNRSRARDEAMEVLQTVIDLGASPEASAQALADISRIAANIEKEANMESLIKAKGFEECIAVISDDTVNIIVKSDELLPNEVAQIKEIAYVSAGILPEHVVINLRTQSSEQQ